MQVVRAGAVYFARVFGTGFMLAPSTQYESLPRRSEDGRSDGDPCSWSPLWRVNRSLSVPRSRCFILLLQTESFGYRRAAVDPRR